MAQCLNQYQCFWSLYFLGFLYRDLIILQEFALEDKKYYFVSKNSYILVSTFNLFTVKKV